MEAWDAGTVGPEAYTLRSAHLGTSPQQLQAFLVDGRNQLGLQPLLVSVECLAQPTAAADGWTTSTWQFEDVLQGCLKLRIRMKAQVWHRDGIYGEWEVRWHAIASGGLVHVFHRMTIRPGRPPDTALPAREVPVACAAGAEDSCWLQQSTWFKVSWVPRSLVVANARSAHERTVRDLALRFPCSPAEPAVKISSQ